MRISVLYYLIFLFCTLGCEHSSYTIYIGTYTDGESEGIYKMNFNESTGTLSNSQLVAKETNPSFLAFDKNKEFLYAVNESANFENRNIGSVVSFGVAGDGTLKKLGRVSSEGAHPCHVAVSQHGERVVVSNYSGGTVAVFESDAGKLSKAVQVMDHSTPDLKSHVHAAFLFENSLYVADLGRNAIYRYLYKDQKYLLESASLVSFSENSGPRHFVMSADNQFLYVIHEYANIVSVSRKNEGGFEGVQQVSTLEESYEGTSYCADIHLSADERFLYGSNRGENTIVVFERNADSGKLSRIQNIDVKGDWPRNFTLSPNGKFLLVANQKSNNISVFNVDKNSGVLTFNSSVDFPSPVCLLF